MVSEIKKAVIPVAGLGTRMLPATKAMPKELLPIYDRPIIEHVVKEAIAGGVTDIILVTRSGKEAIENHFDANYELEHRLDEKGKKNILGAVKNILPKHVTITSVRQSNALGLGHAVLCAQHLIKNEPFAVLLPDVLVLDKESHANHFSFMSLVECWRKSGKGQVMVERINWKSVEKYGIADFGTIKTKLFETSSLRGLIEKPKHNEAPSNLAVLGRYILPPKAMKILAATKPGYGDEIQLTDALDELIRTDGLNAMETNADIFDCGNKKGFISANLAVGLRDPELKPFMISIINDILRKK